jgi:hypothetical protein
MNKIAQLKSLVVVTLFIFLFTGCEKDNLTILTDGVWQFENFTTTSDNDDIKSLVALGKAIMTDGTLTFSDDGSYTLDSPVIEAETGSYELVGSTQLIFNDGIARTASIDEISKKKLVYIETYLYLDVTTYSVKYVWVR